jgi:hypothetical protein
VVFPGLGSSTMFQYCLEYKAGQHDRIQSLGGMYQVFFESQCSLSFIGKFQQPLIL